MCGETDANQVGEVRGAGELGFERCRPDQPEEIRDFLTDYHGKISYLVLREESFPLEVEPSAGDGSLIIFDKQTGTFFKGVGDPVKL